MKLETQSLALLPQAVATLEHGFESLPNADTTYDLAILRFSYDELAPINPGSIDWRNDFGDQGPAGFWLLAAFFPLPAAAVDGIGTHQ